MYPAVPPRRNQLELAVGIGILDSPTLFCQIDALTHFQTVYWLQDPKGTTVPCDPRSWSTGLHDRTS